MTTANLPCRFVVVTCLVLGLSMSFAMPAEAQRAGSRENDPEKTKDKVKQKKTMTRTESGLAYVDITVGTGELPRTGHTCVVHYTGWLWDHDTKRKGKKFDTSKERDDSSVDRGTPYAFHLGVGEVIKGWDEGIAGMKTGGKRELLIPACARVRRRGEPEASSRRTQRCSTRSNSSRSGRKPGAASSISTSRKARAPSPERARSARFTLMAGSGAPMPGQRSSTARLTAKSLSPSPWEATTS